MNTLVNDGKFLTVAATPTAEQAAVARAPIGVSVVVEDRGTEECYRVTPAGHIWRAPKSWPAPCWTETEGEW